MSTIAETTIEHTILDGHPIDLHVCLEREDPEEAYRLEVMYDLLRPGYEQILETGDLDTTIIEVRDEQGRPVGEGGCPVDPSRYMLDESEISDDLWSEPEQQIAAWVSEQIGRPCELECEIAGMASGEAYETRVVSVWGIRLA